MTLSTLPQKGLAHILAGAIFISFSGVWVTWSGVEPSVSAFYRVFLGGLFLLAACLQRGEFKPLNRRMIILAGMCGLTFAADLWCWHAAILFVGPGLATILGNFQVLILTGVSIAFFNKRLTLGFIAALPLAFIGLLLIVGFEWQTLSPTYRMGIYLGLATAFFYSLFILSLRRLQEQQAGLSLFLVLMIVSLFSALFLAAEILLTNKSFALPGLMSLAVLAALALFSQVIGWALIANSLPLLIPSVAGLILLLQPTLAFFWDVLIFNRPTSPLNWCGVSLALGAIYLGTMAERTSQTGSAGKAG